MHYELHLPFPPTVNNYYVKTQRGVFISQKGKKFREAISEAIHEQAPTARIDDKMMVEIILYPPDLRKRDVDNYNKSLLDAITKTKLWIDDSYIDQLFVYRGQKVKGGAVFLRITDAAPVLPIGYDLALD